MSPPKPQISLAIRTVATSPHARIFEANALVSSGQTREAIELYTKVLYHDAPGHAIAFLNRSLAYVAFDKPHLAVADAYRAAMAINEMRNQDRRRARSRLLETNLYLWSEKDLVQNGGEWTKADKRFLPDRPSHWSKCELGSLRMDEPHCPLKNENLPVYLQGGLLDLCDRLEVRAIFRLCGALIECGDGAVQDALGLLSDALTSYSLPSAEATMLKNLGDALTALITKEIESFQDFRRKRDDEHTILLPIQGSMVAKTAYPSILQTRVTLTPAVQYFADTYEPGLTSPSSREELSELIADASESCSAYALHQSFRGQLPNIELRAKREHRPGEVLAWERDPWRVTTSSPQKLLNRKMKNKAGSMRLYCDVCASALLVPEGLVTYLLDQQPHPTSPSQPTPDESTAAGGDERNGKQQGPSSPSEHPLVGNDDVVKDTERKRFNDWCQSTGISICHKNHLVVYCSKACRRHRRLFDPGLHESTIEQDLRDEKFPSESDPLVEVDGEHPHSLYSHAKAQMIWDLIFLRIYAAALNSGLHPLEMIKFIRARLSPFDTPLFSVDSSGKARRDPRITQREWNFHNDVVRPIWCVNRFHAAHNQDHFEHLEESDGWVIDTLMIKIRRCTLMARGAMSATVYDPKHKKRRRCYRGLEPWVSEGKNAVYDTMEQYNEVWVGLLDTLTNFIPAVEESKGEKPNCWIKYDEGLWVIAGQPGDKEEASTDTVAVKMGDRLLRPRFPFLGGSPYEFAQMAQNKSETPTSATDHHRSSEPSGEDSDGDENPKDPDLGSEDMDTASSSSSSDNDIDAEGDTDADYDDKIAALQARVERLKQRINRSRPGTEGANTPGGSRSFSGGGFASQGRRPPFRNGEEALEWYERATWQAKARKKRRDVRMGMLG
ncbi:MAG: hypothetical protein Q9222_003061 [Ikaeria aurantiellina]